MLKRHEILKAELKKLLTKEVIMYFVAVPLMVVLVFGFLYTKRIGREYPIVVVDAENNAVSRLAVFYLESSPELHVREVVRSLPDGFAQLENGNAVALVYFHKGFYIKVLHKSSQPVNVYVDSRNLIQSNSVFMGIAKTLGTARIGAEFKLMDKYFPVPDRMEKILPLKVISRSIGNPSVDYFLFVLSALFLVGIQQGILVGSCMGIATEIELGTFRSTIEACRGPIKYFFYRHLAVMIFNIPLVLLITFLFFTIYSVPSANYLLCYAMILLFSGTVINFSNVIGTLFRHRLMVLQVLFFFALPVFFVSGYTFPLENIPPFLKTISMFLPTTPILNVLPRINYIEGAGTYVHGFIWHQAGLYFFYMLLSFITVPIRAALEKRVKKYASGGQEPF